MDNNFNGLVDLTEHLSAFELCYDASNNGYTEKLLGVFQRLTS